MHDKRDKSTLATLALKHFTQDDVEERQGITKLNLNLLFFFSLSLPYQFYKELLHSCAGHLLLRIYDNLHSSPLVRYLRPTGITTP